MKLRPNEDPYDDSLHEQTADMLEVVNDDQIALILLGEAEQQGEDLSCHGTCVVKFTDDQSSYAMAGMLADFMTQQAEVRDVILQAVDIYRMVNIPPNICLN